MPSLVINGTSVTVPDGTTILQACEKMGAKVPFYCYHPGLSIAGNCRICLVEVEKNPKLQISCYTQAAEGMSVLTESAKAKAGRKDVLEFLLANHPLDCPVCDQAGECWLQDYYMRYGLYDPKFDETKVKKPKAVPIGPTVILDAERCILCSRCVRFCDEVTKTGELGIFNRGDHAELNIYPGKTLDNKYSGNVVDICPVGALTDRDFRFKCRVWYLASQDSVCPGCSMGCNIQIDYNKERQWRPHIAGGDRVMRLKPRYNEDVNKWWMCDEGRYGYKFIDHNRLTAPQLRENGQVRTASWQDALEAIRNTLAHLQQAKALDQVGVIASTLLTNEELFMVRELFAEKLGCQVTADVPAKLGFSDDLLMKPDKSPNSRGAKELGLIGGNGHHVTAAKLLDLARQGKLKVLYVFGYDLVELFGDALIGEAAKHLEMLVFQGSNMNDTCAYAHVVLPSATYAEKDGTFTNIQGRVQRIRPAFPPMGRSRIDWDILEELSNKLNIPTPYQSAAEILQALGKAVPAFKGMTYEKIGSTGMLLAA